MEWKKITDTLNPYLDKAKTYGKKVVDFTEDQIQTTPLFIKTQADYEALLSEKRAVIIAYDDTHPVAQDIRTLVPVWMTRAFMDATKLRFISLQEPAEFVSHIAFASPLDMRVRFEGVETAQFSNMEDIKKWWKSPVYKKDEAKDEKPVDPLQIL